MKKNNILFLSLLILSLSNMVYAQDIKPINNSDESFKLFWSSFKKAVINNQKDKVIGYTNFPFYSEYGNMRDKKSFAKDYGFLFYKEIVNGIKIAQVDKEIKTNDDGAVSLKKLEDKITHKINNFLGLPKTSEVYLLTVEWIAGRPEKYLETWANLVFIKIGNEFKLVSSNDPYLGFE